MRISGAHIVLTGHFIGRVALRRQVPLLVAALLTLGACAGVITNSSLSYEDLRAQVESLKLPQGAKLTREEALAQRDITHVPQIQRGYQMTVPATSHENLDAWMTLLQEQGFEKYYRSGESLSVTSDTTTVLLSCGKNGGCSATFIGQPYKT